MFQFMMPVDYLKTSMALMSRVTELQLEMFRVSMGLADDWTGGALKPDLPMLRLFKSKDDTDPAPTPARPAVAMAPAVVAKPAVAPAPTPARKALRPVAAPAASSPTVVPLEAPKAPLRKPAAPEAAPEPKTRVAAPPRRRAPSRPQTPEGLSEPAAAATTTRPADELQAKASPRRRTSATSVVADATPDAPEKAAAPVSEARPASEPTAPAAAKVDAPSGGTDGK